MIDDEILSPNTATFAARGTKRKTKISGSLFFGLDRSNPWSMASCAINWKHLNDARATKIRRAEERH